jgi:hypothetical protein
MRGIYTRPHRNSIYEPTTVHYKPFEVLRESFLCLLKRFGSDLSSQSLACRAWRVVSLDLMNSVKRFVTADGKIERFVSGLHLRSILVLERCVIKHLILDTEFIEKELISMIARVVAPTLSALDLWFEDRGNHFSDCCEALDVLFNQCDGIQNLLLVYFDFGDDPTAISQTVKDGFGRLNRLELIDCRGDIRMFVENTPIPNIKRLRYVSVRGVTGVEEDYEIIAAFATGYRTLVNVKLVAKFESSALLLKIVECCRDLERVYLNPQRNTLMLNRSDILAVASFPRLQSLDISGFIEVANDALSALVRCKRLKELMVNPLVDRAILEAIRRNLVWLNLRRPSKEKSC